MTAEGPPGRLHVGFVAATTGYLRNFESSIVALLERGHRVTLLVEPRAPEPSGSTAGDPVVQRLSRHAGFEIRITPVVASRWDALGLRLRAARDYWRYFDPRFAAVPIMKERVGALAPPGVLRLENTRPQVRRLVSALVGKLEKRLPVPAPYVREIRDVAPDALLITPLIYLGSSQVQWLRAARGLGVPTAFCVHSWDNLTTKGVLHDTPSAVMVWNSAQCDEAVEFHGVDRARCLVTGAPGFDHWFSMRPTLSRGEFLAKVGLPEGSPLILYLCSSRFIARNEAKWVERWIRAVRGSDDERVATASILIRPHPQNAKQWGRWQSSSPAVQVFPAGGEIPAGDGERANFFHSMLYADVIVGLNSSSLVEAAIFGKPVLSVTSAKGARYRQTLHFGHLAKGLLIVAADHREHVRQIGDALRSPGFSDRCRQFVQEFVRPLGRDHSAGDHMAEAVEKLARTGRGTRRRRNGS